MRAVFAKLPETPSVAFHFDDDKNCNYYANKTVLAFPSNDLEIRFRPIAASSVLFRLDTDAQASLSLTVLEVD